MLDEIRRMTPQSTRLWLVLGAFLAGLALCFGVIGLFAAVAAGFCLYAALLVRAVLKVKEPGLAKAAA